MARRAVSTWSKQIPSQSVTYHLFNFRSSTGNYGWGNVVSRTYARCYAHNKSVSSSGSISLTISADSLPILMSNLAMSLHFQPRTFGRLARCSRRWTGSCKGWRATLEILRIGALKQQKTRKSSPARQQRSSGRRQRQHHALVSRTEEAYTGTTNKDRIRVGLVVVNSTPFADE